MLAILLTCSVSSFASVCRQIRQDTLRLHILANSNSESDQALKLAVRDAILAQSGELFDGAADKLQAEQKLSGQLEEIRRIALDTLRAAGCADKVEVELVERYFDTTSYPDSGLTLPAGRYDAVQVRIGDAAGKNWFCVLFPPLCVPAASDRLELYTEEERRVTGGDYEIRFALVEWVERLRESQR